MIVLPKITTPESTRPSVSNDEISQLLANPESSDPSKVTTIQKFLS